jgi:diguanylate cyclase (GGDEF)-like protein
VPEKTLRYAYVEKRPYFGAYIQGLISDFHVMEDIGSYLIAPILDKEGIVASLNLYSKNPEKFSPQGRDDFIRSLALRVGIALKNLHSIFTVKYQAEHDFLTGGYNKSVMHTLLARYIERLRGTGKGFSFILYDLDDFKHYNNIYGHVTGDEVLKAAADSIRKVMKNSGEFGRFGGDELYIILDYTEDGDIAAFHDRVLTELRDALCALNIDNYAGISGGYVSVPRDIDIQSEDAIEIVKKADMGLYCTKTSGKGAIECGCAKKAQISRINII